MQVSKDQVRDLLLKFKERSPVDLIKREPFDDIYWTTHGLGLGDVSFLTILPKYSKKVYAESVYLDPLMSFNDYYIRGPQDISLYRDVLDLIYYDFGCGHFLQVLQRAIGENPDIKPKSYLNISEINTKKIKNSVLVNLEGHNFSWVTEKIIPTIQDLIDSSPDFNFTETFADVQEGYLWNVDSFHVDVIELIKKMMEFEYFIGIDSGLMHLAAVLDIKSVIIVVEPKVDELYLPKPTTKPLSSGYLYPQNVHFHLNGKNELTEEFNVENLKRALNGEIYPYWTDQYLDLIFEKEFLT